MCSHVQQHGAVVFDLLPHTVELQLRTVLIDAAMLDVPARSSRLALDQKLAPQTGSSARFGCWLDVLAKGFSQHKEGTLHDLWWLYLKCESDDVSISDLHLKDHLSLICKIDHFFHKNSIGLVTPVRGGERSNKPDRCSDMDLQ